MTADRLVVRCNWCMAEFYEDEIPIDEEGDEYCPECGAAGALMDMPGKKEPKKVVG